MKTQELELINRLGLHARAASKLVQTASRFDSQIWLSHQGKRVNAKSIMGVLLLAAPCGSRLTLEVDGSDEEDAAQAITQLVGERFGEDE
ncbi:MAG TPA: HPr family phosphocarrier protein [Wenzhouxiangella sp.]|nr:HPr family phosphocarrier protein [Wenzhouxiangella sp.]